MRGEFFFGRPTVPQLDLDLAEVRIYDGCPTQVDARTTDGLRVYIRYRGGWLSVQTWRDGEDTSQRRCLFEERIGPPLHGEIFLEQISEITGIRIRGERLVFSEEAWRREAEQAWTIDFSGRRRFFAVHGQATATDVADFGKAVMETFEGSVAFAYDFIKAERRIRVLPDDGARDAEPQYCIAIQPDADRFPALMGRDHVALDAVEDACALALQIGGPRSYPLARPNQHFTWRGVRFTAPGKQIVDLEQITECDLRLKSQYEIGRQDCVTAAEALIALIDRHFASAIEEVDLASGTVIGRTSNPEQRYGREVSSWCRAAENRYLFLRASNPDAALRPAR